MLDLVKTQSSQSFVLILPLRTLCFINIPRDKILAHFAVNYPLDLTKNAIFVTTVKLKL